MTERPSPTVESGQTVSCLTVSTAPRYRPFKHFTDSSNTFENKLFSVLKEVATARSVISTARCEDDVVSWQSLITYLISRQCNLLIAEQSTLCQAKCFMFSFTLLISFLFIHKEYKTGFELPPQFSVSNSFCQQDSVTKIFRTEYFSFPGNIHHPTLMFPSHF